MTQVLSRRLYEAEGLLKEIDSWTEEDVEELPKLYRKKAREYRRPLQ